eukprot:6792016-Pyramimonas_sp.AAC.1
MLSHPRGPDAQDRGQRQTHHPRQRAISGHHEALQGQVPILGEPLTPLMSILQGRGQSTPWAGALLFEALEKARRQIPRPTIRTW